MNYDNIKTHQIDPSTFIANNRVVYSLAKDTVYRSNLKLMNVGFLDTAGIGAYHNRFNGSLGQIKSISIVDKGVELSKQKFVHPLMSYLNQLGSNDIVGNVEDIKNDISVAKKLSINDGEEAGGSPAGNSTDTGVGKQINTENYPEVIEQNQNRSGELELSKLLPLLGNMEYIPTNLFNDCKIVIEFYSSLEAPAYVGTDTRVRVSNASLDPVMYLMAEEVLGAEAQNAMDNISSLSWNEMEHDQVVIPRGVQNEEQISVKRVKGFDNKSVGRLLLIQEPEAFTYTVGNVIAGYGRDNSQTQKGNKLNYIVNGKTLLTDQGSDSPASRMALTVDSMGDYVSYMGANDINLSNDANWLGDGNNLVGNADYFAVILGQKIENLQISHKRTPTNAPGAGRNGQLTLHLYGEVGKSLSVGNGTYKISYN
jgi:hypothetical protein